MTNSSNDMIALQVRRSSRIKLPLSKNISSAKLLPFLTIIKTFNVLLTSVCCGT